MSDLDDNSFEELEDEQDQKEKVDDQDYDGDKGKTPFSLENRDILKKCSISDYEKAFHQIYLELLDFGKGLHHSKQSFIQALLNKGSHENPHDIFEYIDMLSSRLEKIHIVKRLCMMLGLVNEMDQIIEQEINLIYNGKSKATRSAILSHGVVAGDVKGGMYE